MFVIEGINEMQTISNKLGHSDLQDSINQVKITITYAKKHQ